MTALAPEALWLSPRTLEEALAARSERGEDATVVAGGTFVSILLNQRLGVPECFLSLRDVAGLSAIAEDGTDLVLGAMATHRDVERSPLVAVSCPPLLQAFSVVATPRIRNQATVGGVVAHADYASDPPTMLTAVGASAALRSTRGTRRVPLHELVVGAYATVLEPDELLTEIRVPLQDVRGVYRKFRTRSHEDLPCVGVAAVVAGGELRVVVGAACTRPAWFPELCRLDDPGAIADGYAAAIDTVDDIRGSAAYRRRIVAVEVRRALEDLRRDGIWP